MSNIEAQKLLDFLAEKWEGHPCPICGKGPWIVQQKTYQLTEFSPGSIPLPVEQSSIVPVVPVSCENCGYTALVNAIIAGILAPAKSE